MRRRVSLFTVGLGLYLRRTRAADRTGTVALWGLIGFLLVIYFGNVFGPPPPSVAAIAWAGQAQWLLVAWAYWIDRHRTPVAGGHGSTRQLPHPWRNRSSPSRISSSPNPNSSAKS